MWMVIATKEHCPFIFYKHCVDRDSTSCNNILDKVQSSVESTVLFYVSAEAPQ